MAVAALCVTVAACQQQEPTSFITHSDRQVRQPDTTAAIPKDAASARESQQLMKEKLAHAKALLKSIVLEDFDKVIGAARRLILISQQTDLQIQHTITDNVLSTEFRRIAQDMADHATRKNIHAVTLDYMQMTLTCIKCHSLLRQQGVALSNDTTPLMVQSGQ